MEYRQARHNEPLIFELSKKGRRASFPTQTDVPKKDITIPKNMLRKNSPLLPEMSEGEVYRHFLKLSQMNYAIDVGTYPLGSCTMKFNPKINETVARLPKIAYTHPAQPCETVQGVLKILYDLQNALSELAGLPHCTLQPAAGAQGEYVGLALIRAYHHDHGDTQRDEIIVPDASHGTNPASSSMNGFKTIVISTNEKGQVDLDELKAAVSEKTAGLMLTNPNTIGIFESKIEEIAKIVKEEGGLLYYDGANFNAIMGKIRPGDMGFDVLHYNLHKTFSTPHGGGGPGVGAVCCSNELAPYLPIPIIEIDDEKGIYTANYEKPKSIGKIHGFYGNIGVCIRAYAYICALGKEGLKKVAEHAVLVSNYMLRNMEKIEGLNLTYAPETPRKHEFVLSADELKKEYNISAMDVAKLLLNKGLHAPTVYFPLNIHEALMVEPTENENKERIDAYVKLLKEEIDKAKKDEEYAHQAPKNTAIGRVDDVYAARNFLLSWRLIKQKKNK